MPDIELKGFPTRTGVAEGRIFVFDKSQGEAFKSKVPFAKGGVLVATTTNPGMMDKIKMASAVVCEGGGRTSHAALVCSEIGKPCVVGVQGLMSAIDTWRGAMPIRMAVDGTTGIVRILDYEIKL